MCVPACGRAPRGLLLPLPERPWGSLGPDAQIHVGRAPGPQMTSRVRAWLLPLLLSTSCWNWVGGGPGLRPGQEVWSTSLACLLFLHLFV